MHAQAGGSQALQHGLVATASGGERIALNARMDATFKVS